MKNRNYLILAIIIGLILLSIFSRFTIGNTAIPIGIYWDQATLIGLIIGIFLTYIIAFSDINQVSDSRLIKYRFRWAIDMLIYGTLFQVFAQFSGLVATANPYYSEAWIKFIGNFWVKFLLSTNLIESTSVIDWENVSPMIAVAGSFAIGLSKLLYGFSFAFSFYVLTFFVKDRNNIDSIKSGNRIYANTISLFFILVFIFVLITVNVSTHHTSIYIFFRKYVLLFLFSIMIFYYFQPNASLSMFIKNLFCDCVEEEKLIRGQLQAIFKTKRIIMCLCFISVMFIPTAIFGGLSFHVQDSYGIFILLSNSMTLMFWGCLSLLFLTLVEGKYNYKLFHHSGSLMLDNMFSPKFVALPVILIFLMIVVVFILFNVLF